MRVSTSGMFRQAVEQMLRLQTDVAETREAVGSGRRHARAADDPAAVANAATLDSALAEMSQFRANGSAVRQRLELEEDALASVGEVLQRMRELAIRGHTDTLDATQRAALATEAESLQARLVDLANRGDGHGRYLFGGTDDADKPFAMGAGGAVTYAGDGGTRQVRIAAGSSVADGDPGNRVFLGVPGGNGRFQVSAPDGNTGAAYLRDAAVTDAAAYDGGAYTVTFSGGGYQVADDGGAVVASGTYEGEAAIEFRGIRLEVAGAPDDGDRLRVAPSAPQSVFEIAGNLVAALQQSGPDGAADAARRTALHGVMEGLDQSLTRINDVRTSVGVRLQAIERTGAAQEGVEYELSRSLSRLRDMDVAEAASELSLQANALRAAQSAFARVQRLSLFDLLR